MTKVRFEDFMNDDGDPPINTNTLTIMLREVYLKIDKVNNKRDFVNDLLANESLEDDVKNQFRNYLFVDELKAKYKSMFRKKRKSVIIDDSD